ncbi:hypothetical protein BU63_28585 [Escherichia coli O118:H16 str. 07-4255]|nr:hypothetical protein BU63_28585 [Escherichia coli O118:H16 str. 07-4255]
MERNASDRNRLDVLCTPDLVNQFASWQHRSVSFCEVRHERKTVSGHGHYPCERSGIRDA